jgi:hypothetical protein
MIKKYSDLLRSTQIYSDAHVADSGSLVIREQFSPEDQKSLLNGMDSVLREPRRGAGSETDRINKIYRIGHEGGTNTGTGAGLTEAN